MEYADHRQMNIFQFCCNTKRRANAFHQIIKLVRRVWNWQSCWKAWCDNLV